MLTNIKKHNMKTLRNIFLLGCCFLAVALYTRREEPAPVGEELTPETLMPGFTGVHMKQYGTIYRSAQPDQDQLNRMLNEYPIDVVIRLNRDTDGMTVEEEAYICRNHTVQFYYFNIEGNIPEVYSQIRNLLRGGNALVHCRHGYDRTGVIMGLWLKEQGATEAEILAFNQWQNYLENKGEQYRKYWDAVFN